MPDVTLSTATAAVVTDTTTGALIRNVRLGKNHPPLVSIARALESNYPDAKATFDFGRTPFEIVMCRKGTLAPLHRFKVEWQA